LQKGNNGDLTVDVSIDLSAVRVEL